MSLGYGEQKKSRDGRNILPSRHRLLSEPIPAVGGGNGNRLCHWVGRGHGIYQTIRYGKYEVTYRHLSQCLRQLLPKRQGRSDHRHQWRPAAHGGEV